MTTGDFNSGHRNEFNHIYPNNPAALKVVRRQIFSQGYKKSTKGVPTVGKTMDKESFKAWKGAKKLARSKSTKANKQPYLER